MFLKRIEIQGFKSFPEKLKLDFKKGITSIVGPNGSGKSNISDAIRWVLGEQRIKNLRGDKMEDIIFGGTKNRKPLGFAEVSITIDNSDKKLNLDFSEVSITRKVYRSGESYYLINGANCRLKDIHELFMDTGIGKEGYSIISQGKIDTILSNRAEDRKALFEEAVGIVKFKNRRIQSENKLEEVRQNLIRTNDIIEEIEKQIKPLEFQKEKAKKYLILEDNLKLIRINIFAYKYKISQIEINKIENDIKIFLDDVKKLEHEKQNLEKNQEFLKNEIAKNNQINIKLNEEISNLMICIEQEETYIKLNLNKIQFIDSEIERITQDNLSFKDIIKNKKEEIFLIKTSLEAKTFECSLKQQNLDILLKEFETIKLNTTEKEKILKQYNVNIVDKMKLSSELKNKLNFYENSKKQYKERNDAIIIEINLHNSKIIEKTIRKKALQKTLEQLQQKDNTVILNLKENNKNLERLEQNLNLLNEEFSDKNKHLIELKNRKKILIELEENYEGYFNPVKAILKEKKINSKFYGIVGVVGEIIKVCKEYQTAIEIALGNSIQNIVTNTEEDAKIGINYLKLNNKGRATFLPLTSIKPKNIEITNFENEKGFVGIAIDLVNFNSQFNNIISSLLGRIVIIDNIENAVIFSKKYNYNYKIVTLDGQVINSGGSLTGGSVTKKETGIFLRNSEIQNITDKILLIQKEIEQITLKQIEFKDKKSKVLLKIQNNENDAKNIFEQKTSVNSEITQNEIFIQDLSEKLQSLNKEKNELLELYNFQDEEVISKDLEKVDKELSSIKNQFFELELELEKNKIITDKKFNEINDLKITLANIKNQIENDKKDISRIKNELEQNHEKQSNFYQEIKFKENEKFDINVKITSKKDTILSLKDKHKTLKENYSLINENNLKIDKKINNCAENIMSIMKKISELQNQIIKIEAKKENINLKLDTFIEDIWESYKITYASACNDFENLDLSYDELKMKENELKKEIHSLGTINISAIEDFEKLKERYDFTTDQKEDILKSDKDLKDIISTLVKEMENQFKKQFDLINKNFSEVFSSIFGGGTAKLSLTDDNNILTSGIEIVAQPPGKNLQNLNLLSGGERTLTAMSLLFAILKMKPSPFCILDETEASLDDANVIRYANFIKNFSLDNQFIVITHKSGTMEVSDALYGITMEEQGISKVISIQLKDIKNYKI